MTKKSSGAKTGGKPRIHKELEGFEMTVNQFGEIQSSMNIEKINEFLDRNVDDKKLSDREDLTDKKRGKSRRKKTD